VVVLLSALFSGAETAFLSADRLRIALRKEQGSQKAIWLTRFFKDPSTFLGTMLVGNNIVLVIFGNLMESALTPFLFRISPTWLSAELVVLMGITLISTLVILIFGEFMPKILFRLFSTSILMFFTYVLVVMRYLLAPLVLLMVGLSEFLIKKILRLSVEIEPSIFTRLDLKYFLEQTTTEELDTEMFEKAMILNQTQVKHCMIERELVEAIDVNASMDSLKKLFIKSGFSKIIVFDKTLDSILGYVHHHHLLRNPTSIRSILFDIPSVAPEMPVIDLMNAFMTAKTSIGVVQQNNKTIGIITLEDILEEVFGEIEDEHD
jgi:putative hemolysin